MNKKENIFEAWIMSEHLSEGNFNAKKEKNTKELKNAQEELFSYCKSKVSEGRLGAKAGFALYINVFEFNDVVEFLRKKYSLKATYEDIKMGYKFTAALFFDKELNALPDKTFVTASGYIRQKKMIPDKAKELYDYESELRAEFEQSFSADSGASCDQEKFSMAMHGLFQKFGFSSEKCYVKLLNNYESEATVLHSFFIDDLKKALSISSSNLDAYINGFDGKRIDLDSDSSSSKYNAKPFESILQPRNYPSGRFPENPNFALSFMQQIAVNLSTGYDSTTIRSVNGPPGTGKTTLLKDIFAELIVRQAEIIVNMKNRTLRGNNNTIGELPDDIAENGIVVASSNNSAVQNIVNELPLIANIDKTFKDELKSADYFWDLSNQRLSAGWEESDSRKKEVLEAQASAEEDKFWGLFSLEGGKSDNMKNIIVSIKHIIKYLSEDEHNDSDAYDDFREKYNKVCGIREKVQSYAECCERQKKYSALKAEQAKHIQEAHSRIAELEAAKEKYTAELQSIEDKAELLAQEKGQSQNDRQQLSTCLEAIQRQKPGLFAKKSRKDEYSNSVSEITEKLLKAIEKENMIAEDEKKLRQVKSELQKNIDRCSKECTNIQNQSDKKTKAIEKELSEYNAKITEYQADLSGFLSDPINMELSYGDLQMTNPWFGKEYRIAQSSLFISALRVRKQFLRDNRKNLDAAVKIWDKQDRYINEKPHLIPIAWNWINFAIPVISSTFASFSRMCRNLGVGTIGHLFIDEAGQALPQAAVGAVFRSRHVMAVGDPKQIKPVLTLDSNVLSMLANHFETDSTYLSDSASVQTLTDRASKYGFYFDREKSDESWIGIPLWVHRRCKCPMFTISNAISYENMMVQGKDGLGRTGWFDVSGTANDKYVKEQGEFLKETLSRMIENDPKIADITAKDTVYVISPFSNVAQKLAELLKTIGFTRYDEQNKPANVGTIHTFQGKEAPVVFMVLGADRNSKGAARWAVGEPNMINVAATRAKEEFYIIGDKKLYGELKSDVADTLIKIINEYSKNNPADNNAEHRL